MFFELRGKDRSRKKPSLQKWYTLGGNCFASPKTCSADEKLNKMIEEEKLSKWNMGIKKEFLSLPGPLFKWED